MADELDECKERNRELEEQNELLRESAETFGALADRLNQRCQHNAAADPSQTEAEDDTNEK